MGRRIARYLLEMVQFRTVYIPILLSVEDTSGRIVDGQDPTQ